MRKSNSNLGFSERLGPVLTSRMFERDIRSCNKFRKIQKQTLAILMKKIHKERVKEVVQSLREFNRKLLKQNGIKELVDDSIYLNVKFAQNIEHLSFGSKIDLIGG